MEAAAALDWKLDGPKSPMSTQYTIGKLAKAVGVPVSTVRYYEQRGLLKPDARSASSYRLYGTESMKRLRFIRAAQASGFTLEDIAMLLEIRGGSLDPCAEVQTVLARRLKRVEEQLAELTRVRGVLSESIQWCRAPHEEGCCQVIDDLDSVAESSEDTQLQGASVPLPSTPDEIAGALFHGLRGSLRDARLYVTVKRLLSNGEPVSPKTVADALDESTDEIRRTLDSVPGIERDGRGNVLGWGLTLNPTPHRFDVEGHALFTWCAFDTLFFPALLGRTVAIHSTCPQTENSVELTVRPDAIEAVSPAETVVSIVLPDVEATRRDVRDAFCNHVHYFTDKQAASGWLDKHSGGLVLSAVEAFEVGRRLSQQILVEAGEA